MIQRAEVREVGLRDGLQLVRTVTVPIHTAA
jgi:hypothetical protein